MRSPEAAGDRYRTLEDGSERELRVLGSRFLARAVHVPSNGAAAARLEAVRRIHHAATHVCWALRLGPPESPVVRSDDDGEPGGTAGRPILGRLEAAELYDGLVHVVRYFGGTKLGTGGLARAYGEAAELALDAAPRRVVVIEARVEVRCDFGELGAVEAVLGRHGGDLRAVERFWEPSPRLVLVVPRSRANGLAADLGEALAGRGRIRVIRTTDEPSSE